MSVYADDVPYIIDDCDVLEDNEAYEFSMMASVLSDTYGVQIIYICTDDMEGLDNEGYAKKASQNYNPDCIIMVDNQAEGTIYVEAFGAPANVLTSDDCESMLLAYNKPATYYEGVQMYYEKAIEVLLVAGFYAGNEETIVEAQMAETVIETEAQIEETAEILKQTLSTKVSVPISAALSTLTWKEIL